jgi:Lrp/AsnC family transcriptional regulator, leucine-responsive regulatory protein
MKNIKEWETVESIVRKMLDDLDIQILDILQNEAQVSNSEIAKRVNMSPPATHTRIRRLEKEGYINRHVAILNQEKLGFDLLTFIFMSTTIHQDEKLEVLEKALNSMPEVLECHCITGEYDYLLKVTNKDRRELESFIRKLNKLGITRIQTSLALREIKYSTVLPISQNPGNCI